MNLFFKKSWISPFMACAFLILAVSGILMLFHVKTAMLESLHEWIGLFFVAAVSLHILLNWKVLLAYPGERKAAVSIIAALSLSILLILSGLFSEGGHDDHHAYQKHSHILSHR